MVVKSFSMSLRLLCLLVTMTFGSMAFAAVPTPPVSLSKIFGTTQYGYTLQVTQATAATGTAWVHDGKMYVQEGKEYTFRLTCTEADKWYIGIQPTQDDGITLDYDKRNGSQDGAGPNTTYIYVAKTFTNAGTHVIAKAFYYDGDSFSRLSMTTVDVEVNSIKVDLVDTNVSTCTCDTNVAVNLSEDSYPGSGTIWTVDPALGISELAHTDRQYSFNPSDSTPGKYVITARSRDLVSCSDTATVYIARLSFNDIKAIHYNKIHRDDISATSSNKITLTIEGALAPGKEVCIERTLLVDLVDPVSGKPASDLIRVSATTELNIIGSNLSSAPDDQWVAAKIVSVGELDLDIFRKPCAKDKFITYAYYTRGFENVVLQRKDSTNHCSECLSQGIGLSVNLPSDGHLSMMGATNAHPIHDENWAACKHCNWNCARAVVVMLGLASSQDEVMRTGTTTLAENHGVGKAMKIPDLAAVYDLEQIINIQTRYDRIRGKNALGIVTLGPKAGHAYLVNGARKNDDAGNITDATYQGHNPADGDPAWMAFDNLLVQPQGEE